MRIIQITRRAIIGLLGLFSAPVSVVEAAQVGQSPTRIRGAGNVQFLETARERTASVTPVDLSQPPGAIQRYYPGAGDVREALQAALNCNARVFSVDGWQTTYPISNFLLIPEGTLLHDLSLVATADVTQHAGWGANHQGQLLLLSGDGARVRNVRLNGDGFNAGGVGLNGFARNEVDGCDISRTGGSQGILLTSAGTTLFKVTNNLIYYAAHGIEHWQVVNGIIGNNVVRVVAGGGIWGTDSLNLQISGNSISDCGDVGLDCEGGVNCHHSGNAVSSCNNGEIAVFANGGPSARVPANCSFMGNTAHHTATYQSWSGNAEVTKKASRSTGSLLIASITPGQAGIVFSNNAFLADVGSSLFSFALGDAECGIALLSNTFASRTFTHIVQGARGIIAKSNIFRALAGAESARGTLKNCSGASWVDNTYVYEIAPKSAHALHYYADVELPVAPVIANNTFINTGAYSFLHETVGDRSPAVVFDNRFSEGFVPQGGVYARGACPAFRGQRLYIQTGSTMPMSNLAGLDVEKVACRGRLMMVVVGAEAEAKGTVYEFSYSNGVLVSRDGSGPGSGIGGDKMHYATFTGTTIMLTSSGPILGQLELDVISRT